MKSIAPTRPYIPGLALLALLACGGGCGALPGRELLSPARFEPLRRAEAIVVLGNRPAADERGRVRPETERRVRQGVALFLEGYAPRLVVTGGRTTSSSARSEAEVMAGLARRLGVPREAILLEPEARDTAENARNTVTLLCADRARAERAPGACRPEVIVVSSPYHLERARRLFECAGARAQVAGTEIPEDPGYQAGFTAYEYGARLGGRLAGACARAGARGEPREAHDKASPKRDWGGRMRP